VSLSKSEPSTYRNESRVLSLRKLARSKIWQCSHHVEVYFVRGILFILCMAGKYTIANSVVVQSSLTEKFDHKHCLTPEAMIGVSQQMDVWQHCRRALAFKKRKLLYENILLVNSCHNLKESFVINMTRIRALVKKSGCLSPRNYICRNSNCYILFYLNTTLYIPHPLNVCIPCVLLFTLYALHTS
jgi:hypothetical protein